MTKQELVQAVKEIKAMCEYDSNCDNCPFWCKGDCFFNTGDRYDELPCYWSIEQLEREENADT